MYKRGNVVKFKNFCFDIFAFNEKEERPYIVLASIINKYGQEILYVAPLTKYILSKNPNDHVSFVDNLTAGRILSYVKLKDILVGSASSAFYLGRSVKKEVLKEIREKLFLLNIDHMNANKKSRYEQVKKMIEYEDLFEESEKEILVMKK